MVGGAIGSGRAIRAIEVLGADLAYIGTPFIAAEESLAPDAYKKMVVSSTHEDLIVTNAITGVTGSWLKPSLTAAGLDPAALAKGEAPNFSDRDERVQTLERHLGRGTEHRPRAQGGTGGGDRGEPGARVSRNELGSRFNRNLLIWVKSRDTRSS